VLRHFFNIIDVLDEITGGTLISRLEMNYAAIRLAIDNPVFGIGGMAFLPNSEQIVGSTTYIHNSTLANLAFLGVFGFILYILFHSSLLVLAAKKLVWADGLSSRSFWIVMLTALLGIILLSQWQVVHYFTQSRIGYWIFAGIIIGTSIEVSE
jgi:hypothetical protein